MRWHQLSPLERRMVKTLTEGKPFIVGDGKLPKVDEKGIFPPDCIIRADRLAAFLKGKIAEGAPGRDRVILVGVAIIGNLKLNRILLDTDLWIDNSVLNEVLLQDAELGGLSFDGSRCDGIDADRVNVTGGVFLRKGFEATGPIRLLGAKISGNFECDSAQLNAKESFALAADGAKVTGSIFLRSGFRAAGCVRLLGVVVGRHLDLNAAELFSTDDSSLNADGVKVAGNVFLRRGFRAVGGIDLVRAEIGGALWWQPDTPPDCIVDFRLANSAMFFDGGNWPANKPVLLDGFSYGCFVSGTDVSANARIAWLERQPKNDLVGEFKPQPWRQCIKALRETGHVRDANRVVVAMGRRQRPSLSVPEQAWDWVKDKFLGYGYNPTVLVALIFAIVLFGTFVFQGGYTSGAILPSDSPVYTSQAYRNCLERQTLQDMPPHRRLEKCLDDLYPEYMAFEPFFFSLDIFIPLVDLHQETAWEPRHKDGLWLWGYGVRVWYWFHILSGWVLTTLAVIALTGAVRPKHEEE